MSSTGLPLVAWVLATRAGEAAFELLGDARLVAERLDGTVGILLVLPEPVDPSPLVQHGADRVCQWVSPGAGLLTRVAAAESVTRERPARLVLASGGCEGREWAARLAARAGWKLASPALMAQVAPQGILEVTALDSAGRLSRPLRARPGETIVATFRPGVAEAMPPDLRRRGTCLQHAAAAVPEPVRLVQSRPANPETVDIRYAPRLVAGGRGVGSREGFESLRRFARRIGAGIAASRMAVDLGWIEPGRQVGQTGKTVKPDLYVACGISGAPHHLAGMSEAKHIVAMNTDPEAPIFKSAHLGLVADLHEILREADRMLPDDVTEKSIP
ncbi:MAG: electron transfer flavoprotein subunit alpha/FixB family protein [Planctomycetes bacterium]|nr:electron transfer flavoprotein subunit alpha/FixB family protein [Planctomycetota bacterium]